MHRQLARRPKGLPTGKQKTISVLGKIPIRTTRVVGKGHQTSREFVLARLQKLGFRPHPTSANTFVKPGHAAFMLCRR